MQKSGSKLIYYLSLALLFLVFLFGYYRFKRAKDTMKFHENIEVKILKVVCNEANSKSNYILFSYNKSKHTVNVGRSNCESYIVGDSVNLMYSRQYDAFFTDKIDTVNEEWGMIIIGFFFLLTLYYLLFRSNKDQNLQIIRPAFRQSRRKKK